MACSTNLSPGTASALFKQLNRSSLTVTGRPQLASDGNEVILATQSGVGLYSGDQRLSDCEDGVLYLTNYSLIWVNDSSDSSSSNYAWTLELSRITSLQYYGGFMASHPKITALFMPSDDRGPDSELDHTQSQLSSKKFQWFCSICEYVNEYQLVAGSISPGDLIKCNECGVRSAANELQFNCPTCTFQQTFPFVEGKCSICFSVWHVSTSSNLLSAPSINATAMKPIAVKFSFRSGGYQQFCQKLEKLMKDKSWVNDKTLKVESQAILSPSSPTVSVSAHSLNPNTSRASTPVISGVSSIMKGVSELGKQNEETLNAAFKDLDALMAYAKDMVALAQSISAKMSRDTPNDATNSQYQNMLVNLGVDDPVTKESAGDLYHLELSRQLADFTLPQLSKTGGIIPLTDLYCMYNRARGVALISPKDLQKACKLFEKLSLPVRLRVFESGLSVVQSADFNDSAVIDRIETYLKSELCISVLEFSRIEQMSPILAKEYLLLAEKKGSLCRDDSIEGLKFYRNRFVI